ncbi:MAG: phospho-N-acetylmuramoyl-pentapeptide-transferase [Candidatus Melainabacteria bacterium]|nr:phospho-N-acetylmuramoyl-pentapeptide-transferase [Candidatus Melainabacteria bacterium]
MNYLPGYTEPPHLLALALVSLAISAILLYPYIGWLKKFQIQQYLREDGPKSHAHKAKTPTSGGVCIIIASLVTMLIWMFAIEKALDKYVALVFVWGLVCGLVGLVDDMAKVMQKGNKGVSGKVRLGIETCVGLGLGWLLYQTGTTLFYPSHTVTAPATVFVQGHHVGVFFYLAFGAFLTAAVSNAVNLHDGMDGLAAGTSSQVFATMALIFLATGQINFAVMSAIMAGAVLGFILWNRNPASVFMGDTGSLFIGGIMAALVIAGGIVIWFIPLSLIYNAEALSVMAQVAYYKLTKPFTPEKPMSAPALVVYKLTHKLPGEGKRIFRMAPLHHHFEAVFGEKGVAEWEVVVGFWVAQFILCLLTLAFLYFWR